MSRPTLEVADIFRDHGAAWRQANAGHVSLDQLKVMTAIERCRTAALGGHVERCEDCSYTAIAYNSCRNRHCPKCQGAAAREWLAEREAELLPVPYFHVVFTLPARIAAIAYQNKAVVYDLLFKASSEAVLTIAADPEHLGGRIGITAVLHTWGSTMTHHPHVHMIVPGGGIALDGKHWLSCQPRFLLPVPVLTALFQGRMLAKLLAAHRAGKLTFFGPHAHLAERKAFAAYLAPLRRITWYVYAKPPFGGPKAVLAYLARYTHRVAIANSRLIARDQQGVTFRYKDYRHQRVHPPLPDPRAAQGLPPHPPLRPARQTILRRQHRARPRAARRANAATPQSRCGCRRSQRAANPLAFLPVLRRSYDHDRDIRARLDAASSANRPDRRLQDRHVMTTIAGLRRRTDNLARRWLRTGRDHARPGASSHQRSPTAIAAFYDNLDHQTELPLSDECAINRLEQVCALPRAPSASAKSP